MASLDLATLASGAIGAFFATWAGAHVAFRRTKKERALDKRVAWHEDAIQALARYEERLEHLHRHAMNVLVVQRTRATHPTGERSASPDEMPKLIRIPMTLWKDLGEAEERARAALRLAEPYTSGRTQLECSVALKSTVNVVASQWLDVSAEPEIQWADLQSRSFAISRVRADIQDSLTLTLELDGALAVLLGPKYRRWRSLRRIKKLKKEIAARAP